MPNLLIIKMPEMQQIFNYIYMCVCGIQKYVYSYKKKRKHVQYSLCLLYNQTNVACTCNNKHNLNPSGTQTACHQHSHTPLIDNTHSCTLWDKGLISINFLTSLQNELNHVFRSAGLHAKSLFPTTTPRKSPYRLNLAIAVTSRRQHNVLQSVCMEFFYQMVHSQ